MTRKTLNERATEYAQRNFPINENGEGKAVKHDIAFHGFCEGWNAALSLNPWHSVEEELPKCESKYFVRIEDSKGLEYFDCVSWVITPTSRWWSLGRYTMFGRVKVTHWMNKPELPKEKED